MTLSEKFLIAELIGFQDPYSIVEFTDFNTPTTKLYVYRLPDNGSFSPVRDVKNINQQIAERGINVEVLAIIETQDSEMIIVESYDEVPEHPAPIYE